MLNIPKYLCRIFGLVIASVVCAHDQTTCVKVILYCRQHLSHVMIIVTPTLIRF